jgi:Bacteriophage related domain of unknown function
MSTHGTATATIKRLFGLAWMAGPIPALPIEHENHRFKAPDDAPYGRLTLAKGNTTQMTLGGKGTRVDRTPFILNLQVFIPENKGTRIADQAFDAMTLLNGQCTHEENLTVNLQAATSATSSADKGVAFLISIVGYYDLLTPP